MEKVLVLKDALRKISEGSIFRTLFAWALKIFAVLTVIGILFSSVKLWKAVGGEGVPFRAYLGLFLLQLFLLALGFIVINILLVRSEDIERQPIGADYMVTPIFVIFQKMLGEIAAATYAVLGVGMGLFIWISGVDLPLPIPGLGAGDGFIGGLMAMVMGFLIGFIFLCLSYLMAELTGAVVDIARNTKN